MTPPMDQNLVLGLGCDRGTALVTLQEAVEQALQQLGVTLNAVTTLASINLKAGCAFTAGLGCHLALAIWPDAIEGFCQNAGNGGFTHPPGSGKEPSVVQASLVKGMRQSLNDVVLAQKLREGFGAPRTGQCQCCHASILTRAKMIVDGPPRMVAW